MWGIVGDRHGHRSVLIGAGLWWAIGLGILHWAPTLQVYTLAFACIGLSTTATTIADLSLAMEFGSERDRPLIWVWPAACPASSGWSRP